MVVPIGTRYFKGIAGSSVRNHPPMFTFADVGFRSSMASTWGGSVWASTSLILIGAINTGGSARPGDPPESALALHFDPSSDA